MAGQRRETYRGRRRETVRTSPDTRHDADGAAVPDVGLSQDGSDRLVNVTARGILGSYKLPALLKPWHHIALVALAWKGLWSIAMDAVVPHPWLTWLTWAGAMVSSVFLGFGVHLNFTIIRSANRWSRKMGGPTGEVALAIISHHEHDEECKPATTQGPLIGPQGGHV